MVVFNRWSQECQQVFISQVCLDGETPPAFPCLYALDISPEKGQTKTDFPM